MMKNEAIRQYIDQLRKENKENFTTNFFSLEPIENCDYLASEDALIFWKQEQDFYKLYYAFSNLTAFNALLKNLPPLDLYLEIVSKAQLSAELTTCLLKHFTCTTTYQKFYKKITPQNETEFPYSLIDTKLLYEKLYSTFNIYFEHLMSEEELVSLAKEKTILTIYENNQLQSFIIYKKTGKKAYLNHIANYGSKENLIDLWQKFYQALSYDKISYLDLWYDTQNKKAENMYKIEQFQPLSLYNFCFAKKLNTQ